MKKKCLASVLLLPLSLVYLVFFELVQKFKYRKPAIRIGKKVICVGNVVIGGTGKTPLVQAITRSLQKDGHKVCIILKGYGRKSREDFLIKCGEKCDNKLVGDEAILHSKVADTFVVRERSNPPSEIMEYDYVVMDDGLFDNSVKKDKVLCTFDSDYLTGNDFVLPAGPLRTRLKAVLPLCDHFVFTNFTEQKMAKIENLNIPKEKILTAKTVVSNLEEIDRSLNYIAFSGLGDNGKFFKMLADNDIKTIEEVSYPDHYVYTDNDIELLIQKAKTTNSCLITTEKDSVKLPKNLLDKIKILKIETIMENFF